MIKVKERKSKYIRWGMPYDLAGSVPEKRREEVKSLLEGLCNGTLGVGSFRISEIRNINGEKGAIGFDLWLPALRMENNSEAHDLIRKAAKNHDVSWLVYVLLEKEPMDTHFIFSSDGGLWVRS